MEAVEPLSGFEVGGQQYVPCPHPPTPKRKGEVNLFFTYLHITYYVKKCFFLFFDLFPLLMKQLLSELKTSDLNVDFFYCISKNN